MPKTGQATYRFSVICSIASCKTFAERSSAVWCAAALVPSLVACGALMVAVRRVQVLDKTTAAWQEERMAACALLYRMALARFLRAVFSVTSRFWVGSKNVTGARRASSTHTRTHSSKPLSPLRKRSLCVIEQADHLRSNAVTAR